MTKALDLTGKKFGRLTVIKRVENNKWNKAQWLCKCDCGNEIIARCDYLVQNRTTSCGCYNRDVKTKHNKYKTRLYNILKGMKRRCYNKNDEFYKWYGGRGIKICDEWLSDFMNFYNWAIANGYDENAPRGKCTIDRIDVNGDYEPSNCRFVTNKKQQNNRNDNCYITYKNQTHTLAEWSEILNIRYSRLFWRIKKGWDVEKAFTTPVRKW